jgi:AcrR family transcriptional regulator
MTRRRGPEGALPTALAALWSGSPPTRRPGGLSRDRIVAAAIELADADGLAAVSMARLADRLDCGTMSLYRHVASKDELVVFMLAMAPGPPPPPADPADWRGAVTDWANGLWDVYHRHPWVLHASAAGPPADPGQLAWLEAGLAALARTDLGERDKVAAATAVLHYVRGAAALAIESATGAGDLDWSGYPRLLRRLVDADRFPAVAAALAGGAFDVRPGADPRADLLTGLRWILDSVAAEAGRGDGGTPDSNTR